jgi:hypothetical protein
VTLTYDGVDDLTQAVQSRHSMSATFVLPRYLLLFFNHLASGLLCSLSPVLQWTVYRGVAYDLTSFIDRHPAGNWLINLAIGRDCTGLFESYHLRPEVAVGHLKRLPVLQDFPVDAVPRLVYPRLLC